MSGIDTNAVQTINDCLAAREALLEAANYFELSVNGVTVPLDSHCFDELWDLADRTVARIIADYAADLIASLPPDYRAQPLDSPKS